MKPVIGIPTGLLYENEKTSFSVGLKNILAIEKNGGIPLLLPLCESSDCINAYLDRIDGVYFIGGGDIFPILYGEEPIRNLGSIAIKRDRFEIDLFNLAFERKLPILGVCRGCQVINVASGGSLYQDIYSQDLTQNNHSTNGIDNSEGYHFVKIDNTSKFYNIMGEESLLVNSLHHQAVKRLSDGYKVSAQSTDGVIEAIEYSGDQFCLGIQWHPEMMIERYDKFNKIFEAFINECKK